MVKKRFGFLEKDYFFEFIFEVSIFIGFLFTFAHIKEVSIFIGFLFTFAHTYWLCIFIWFWIHKMKMKIVSNKQMHFFSNQQFSHFVFTKPFWEYFLILLFQAVLFYENCWIEKRDLLSGCRWFRKRRLGIILFLFLKLPIMYYLVLDDKYNEICKWKLEIYSFLMNLLKLQIKLFLQMILEFEWFFQ